MNRPPVEHTSKFTTLVFDMPEAFSFVMAHMEGLEGAPRVAINPQWVEAEQRYVFEVAVSGMAELPAYQPEGL